jgi:hypothetical protein
VLNSCFAGRHQSHLHMKDPLLYHMKIEAQSFTGSSSILDASRVQLTTPRSHRVSFMARDSDFNRAGGPSDRM